MEIETQTSSEESPQTQLAPESRSTNPFGAPVIAEKKSNGFIISTIVLACLSLAALTWATVEHIVNLKQASRIENLSSKLEEAITRINSINEACAKPN